MWIIPGVNEVVNVNVIKLVAVCLSSWWLGEARPFVYFLSLYSI